MSAPHLDWLEEKLAQRREELEEPFFFAEVQALSRKLVSGQGHIYGAIFPSEAIVAARAKLLPQLKEWLDEMRSRGVQLPATRSSRATQAWLDMHRSLSGWFHVPDLSSDADDKLWQADFDLAMRLDLDVPNKRVRYRGERVAEPEFDANVMRANKLLQEVVSQVDPYLNVERMYLFDFSAFSAELYEELRVMQSGLPGYVSKDRFFGDAEAPPHLRCAVEPSGLHVTGCLRQVTWDEWHKALAAQMGTFPQRLLTSFG